MSVTVLDTWDNFRPYIVLRETMKHKSEQIIIAHDKINAKRAKKVNNGRET